MQYSMVYNPSQFVTEWRSEPVGVFMNPFDTDEDISRNDIVDSIVEGYDIGIIIVVQILFVHFEQKVIRTENKTQVARFFIFHFSEAYYLCFNKPFFPR
jgi:hypothetical protein